MLPTRARHRRVENHLLIFVSDRSAPACYVGTGVGACYINIEIRVRPHNHKLGEGG
jgi:hypothetical protein